MVATRADLLFCNSEHCVSNINDLFSGYSFWFNFFRTFGRLFVFVKVPIHPTSSNYSDNYMNPFAKYNISLYPDPQTFLCILNIFIAGNIYFTNNNLYWFLCWLLYVFLCWLVWN